MRRLYWWDGSLWWRTYREGGFDGYRTLTGRMMLCATMEVARRRPDLRDEIRRLAAKELRFRCVTCHHVTLGWAVQNELGGVACPLPVTGPDHPRSTVDMTAAPNVILLGVVLLVAAYSTRKASHVSPVFRVEVCGHLSDDRSPRTEGARSVFLSPARGRSAILRGLTMMTCECSHRHRRRCGTCKCPRWRWRLVTAVSALWTPLGEIAGRLDSYRA